MSSDGNSRVFGDGAAEIKSILNLWRDWIAMGVSIKRMKNIVYLSEMLRGIKECQVRIGNEYRL